jgi:hypothetical protein
MSDVDNVLVEHVTEEAARRSEGRVLTAAGLGIRVYATANEIFADSIGRW